MALPTAGNGLTQLLVQNELEGSTMSTPKRYLTNMLDYVFGTSRTQTKLSAFGGFGIPEIADITTLTGEDGQIVIDFEVIDDGGFGWTAVAQYWVESGSIEPSPYWEQEIKTGSGTGVFSGIATSNISNGNQYEVRVTLYNKFNNAGNYPIPRSNVYYYDFSNIQTVTVSASQYATPSINTATGIADFSNEFYVSATANGAQDNLGAQYRINSAAGTGASRSCSRDPGSVNPEAVFALGQFVNQTNDTVEIRIRCEGSSKAPSEWTAWYTLSYKSVPSCPL